jgi:DNA polymerase III subunit gamma/tau
VPQVSRGSARFYMQYQVLARKWRPQNFREIVGQEHISQTLLNALHAGRVAHAFLFSGPRGSGKTTTARILAKALNCHAGVPGEPCGKCPACVEIAAGNCMDVLEIDAASNTGVDNVRGLIEQVQYNPARDRNKIFIIDEVHMLSNAAFNALLKTLEEPPANVVFIMATTEHHKIPATILSRCQQYSFKLIPFPLILKRLRDIALAENIQISKDALEQIAFAGGGSMRDAMSALDQVVAFSGLSVRDEDVTMLLGLIEPAMLGETVRAIANNNGDALLKIVARLVETGQDLQNFCRRFLAQLRNLAVVKAGVSDPALLGVPEGLIADLRLQAELFSREDLLRLFDAFLKTEGELRYSTQARFQLEMGLIELAQIPRLRPLEELIADFERLVSGEARSSSTNPPVTSAPNSQSRGASAPGKLPGSQARSTGIPAGEAGGRTAEPQNFSQSAAQPMPNLEKAAGFSEEPREFLLRISSVVQKESLQSLLQALEGARLQENTVILYPGDANDFYRRQIRDSLALVAQAASRIVGRDVTVVLRETSPAPVADKMTGPPAESFPEAEILEKARREPIVQSFLDTFPGPVKAEKMDP